jgi:acyl-CoA synthetase (AMP-forming)/AMP-acid ligase II
MGLQDRFASKLAPTAAEKTYPAGVRYAAPMQPIDLIYRAARLTPEAPAVQAPAETLSYRELVTRVAALASALQAIDPRPQSRVGICARNNLEHLLSLLAVMAASKVWVPLNPLDAPSDLQSKMSTAEPTLLVVDEDCLERIDIGAADLILGAGNHRDTSTPRVAGLTGRHRGENPARHALDSEQSQAIKFTGGSSGIPKGVLQPYRAWLAGASNMIHTFGFNAEERYLVTAPLTHGTSCYVTPILAMGGTLVLLDGKTTPEKIIDAFAEDGITATFLPPTLIYMLMQTVDHEPQAFTALRLLIYGAASMPAERIREAQRLFGPVVSTNYGLTEAPQIITALTPDQAMVDDNLASVGPSSFHTRVEIMNPEGELLDSGEQGEIVVGGDLLMTGYLNNSQQTAETLIDGWLHTGDVGYLDERGFLFIKDRLKDVIISGGFNVYPSDVEAALVAHPAVHECVVFGLADEKWGEAVQVAVELRSGAAADAADIIAFAKERVGSVQAPKAVHFMESLPRSAVGKVQRRNVRELVTRSLETDEA